MLGSVNFVSRKLAFAMVVALLSGVQVPVATAATAPPQDGRYDCATGLPSSSQVEQGTYPISNGVASNARCSGDVVIADGVTSIGNYSFYFATITSVSIPSTVTGIGDYAFAQTSALTSVIIPEGVTNIGRSAFERSSALTALTIPSTVTNMGFSAFGGTTALTSLTIREGVTSIGSSAFQNATALTSLTIPSTVTSIGSGAFRNATALTSVTIPSGVTSIGDSAFATSSMTSITVEPGNLSFTSIDGVLFNKSETTLVTYPRGKPGSSYSIKNTVTSIGESAFEGVSALTSITIPSSVAAIGESAFEDTKAITSITIPSTVTSIGDSAFSDSALTSITIQEGVKTIGEYAFSGTESLTSISIPTSVTSIARGTFSYAEALTSITIPSSVTSIGDSAFDGATALTSITIPSSVTSIGDGAFSDATLLKDIYFLGDEPTGIGEYTFAGIAAGATAHVYTTATGFGSEPTWNGLTVLRTTPSYTITYQAAGGSNVAPGSFTTGGTIQSGPVTTRTGYTLVGWSTTSTGSVVSFPYTPSVSANITLHAIWALKSIKPSYVSGAKITGSNKAGESFTASPGKWNGTAPITFKYQWYVCKLVGGKDSTGGKAVPKCTLVKNAQKATFNKTSSNKYSLLAVSITGTNKTGTSTIIYFNYWATLLKSLK